MMLQNVKKAAAFQDEKHDFVDSDRLRESTKMSDFIITHEHMRENYVTVIIAFFRHHALIQAQLLHFVNRVFIE